MLSPQTTTSPFVLVIATIRQLSFFAICSFTNLRGPENVLYEGDVGCDGRSVRADVAEWPEDRGSWDFDFATATIPTISNTVAAHPAGTSHFLFREKYLSRFLTTVIIGDGRFPSPSTATVLIHVDGVESVPMGGCPHTCAVPTADGCPPPWFVGAGGTIIALPQPGHSTCIPTQSISASRCCPQCGQENLKVALAITTTFPSDRGRSGYDPCRRPWRARRSRLC